ncbi:MAG: YggS family pyridoxal phosphate-dependent enzyme, partial [Oscillospiraceae bacterium]|nr:YggS family pyridoxal phosphate-dependent enzyme [Oscillospiraceae bacterium]
MIQQQYKRTLERVHEAAVRAGRSPEEVRLMAVSKTVEPPQIMEAVEAGALLLGENKVQELQQKRAFFPQCAMHLIGHLQSNKAAKAVACADMIQSVDSVRIAREISNAAGKCGKTMPVLLEVNIGREAAKFGFLPEQLYDSLSEIATLPGLKVRGLMTVPPFLEENTEIRKFFSQMYQLFIDIRAKKTDNICMEILSMGMSGDFEIAIAEG